MFRVDIEFPKTNLYEVGRGFEEATPQEISTERPIQARNDNSVGREIPNGPDRDGNGELGNPGDRPCRVSSTGPEHPETGEDGNGGQGRQ